MGRPPLSEDEKRDSRVTVHLTSAEHEELERRAAKRGVRVGEIAREILARVLGRKGR
jgi:predicted DNA binding CopG/RHH family protein